MKYTIYMRDINFNHTPITTYDDREDAMQDMYCIFNGSFPNDDEQVCVMDNEYGVAIASVSNTSSHDFLA